jgi:ABC-type transport system involved in multi-copper enzyme maturation permease subunit
LITAMAGYGAVRLGVGPSGADVVRLIAFYAIAVVYISLWLALSLLLSVLCRRAATAALAAIAIWLVMTLFAGLIAGVVADSAHSVNDRSSSAQVLANARTELDVRRLSPDQLAGEHQTLNKSQPLTVTGSGESFEVNGEAMVVCGNVQTANATVYIIDHVLLPKS